MALEAGKLDRRVTLQRRSMTANELGEMIETWADIATVWAEKVEMRGSERYASQQTTAQYDTKFRIRYRRGIVPVDRLIYDGRIYDLGAAIEIGRAEGIELHGRAVL